MKTEIKMKMKRKMKRKTKMKMKMKTRMKMNRLWQRRLADFWFSPYPVSTKPWRWYTTDTGKKVWLSGARYLRLNNAVSVSLSLLLCMGFAGCQRGPGGVARKMGQDFGILKRPEGYVSGADAVYMRLDEVAKTEIKRLNVAQRQGEIKYQQDGLRGMYYKEVKVYEEYFPLDARQKPRAAHDEGGYNGYIEYAYRYYQSVRKPTRTEALTEPAAVPTDREGREVYRYSFTGSGTWDGSKGQRTRR